MAQPVACYDFTLGAKYVDAVEELIEFCQECSKHWAFQLEEGKDGYRHYQGRISLKVKARLTTFKKHWPWDEVHLSPTSTPNIGNQWYVITPIKEGKVLDGPWKDTDEPEMSLPKQCWKLIGKKIEDACKKYSIPKEMYPWQGKLINMAGEFNDRVIDCIFDPDGNIGKSVLTTYMIVKKIAEEIPMCNDYKDIMRAVCDMPQRGCYIIDMPRTVNKERLYQLYAGIEMCKNGRVFDDRYKFKRVVFDSPRIFVFSNKLPDLNLLSADRWKIWIVSEDKKLVPYPMEKYPRNLLPKEE